MRRSLVAALRLFLRWELWTLVSFHFNGIMVMRNLMPGARYSPGFLPPLQEKTVAAVSCVLLAASAVLLFPLVRGGRSLDFRFLSRNVTTLLGGAAIALGMRLPISLAYDYAGSLSVPGLFRLNNLLRFSWILTDLSVLLCAWYVHGKLEADAGRRPPGLRRTFIVGLVTAVISLSIPGSIPQMLEFEDVWSRLWRIFMGTLLLHFFLAWFYGALGKGKLRQDEV